MALAPSFQSPRSFMSFTRSKRFITERFPVAPPLRFRELCLDMVLNCSEVGARKLGATGVVGKNEFGFS